MNEARDDYPMWGKAKFAVELVRRAAEARKKGGTACTASESTVGRIIKDLVMRGCAKPEKARETHPNRHHGRHPEGRARNHPQSAASGPVSKWTCEKAFSRATARKALDFLDKVLDYMPLKVEGGSGFMAEYEQECRIRGIPLWGLPPRSPKLNGNVERTNQTWRYEFCGCRELPAKLENIDLPSDAFADEFNRVRPHRHLGCKRPKRPSGTGSTTG